VMYEDLDNSSRFVTLFYSEYDPQTKILTYTNAAHNPPLYWQAATDKISRLDTQGHLIGFAADSQYEEAQVQLHQGDTIIYYTDGFTDAANQDGERFDEENLIYAFHTACQQQLTSQATLDFIVSKLRVFTGSGANGDDMTMVVLKVRG
jgi:phosphoserine phosphatase RsbU/P